MRMLGGRRRCHPHSRLKLCRLGFIRTRVFHSGVEQFTPKMLAQLCTRDAGSCGAANDHQWFHSKLRPENKEYIVHGLYKITRYRARAYRHTDCTRRGPVIRLRHFSARRAHTRALATAVPAMECTHGWGGPESGRWGSAPGWRHSGCMCTGDRSWGRRCLARAQSIPRRAHLLGRRSHRRPRQ